MRRSTVSLAWFMAIASTLPAHGRPTPLFRDDFGGRQLDSAKWQAINWNAPAAEGRFGGRFAYRPSGVTVADGTVRLTYDADAGSSGRIQSRTSFLYGDIKVRARLPLGRGLWPAIWLRSPGPVIRDEIDLIEGFGDDPTAAQSTLHWWQDGVALGQSCATVMIGRGPPPARADPACVARSIPLRNDLSDDHMFEVRWTSRAVTWLIDGHAYLTITGNVPHRPMAIVLNLSVESPWSRGVISTGRSAPLVVDSVTVDPVAGSRSFPAAGASR